MPTVGEIASINHGQIDLQIPEVYSLHNLSLLLPPGKNHNVISPFKMEGLKRDILEHGFDEPLQVWENPDDQKLYVVNGHKRYAALVALQAQNVLIVRKQFRDRKEALAYSIRRNQERGQNDDEILADIVKEIANDVAYATEEDLQAALVLTERQLFDLVSMRSDLELPKKKTVKDEAKKDETETVKIQIVITRDVKALLDRAVMLAVVKYDGDLPHSFALGCILRQFIEEVEHGKN